MFSVYLADGHRQHYGRISMLYASFLPVETRMGPVSSGSSMSGLLVDNCILTCAMRSFAVMVAVCVAIVNVCTDTAIRLELLGKLRSARISAGHVFTARQSLHRLQYQVMNKHLELQPP